MHFHLSKVRMIFIEVYLGLLQSCLHMLNNKAGCARIVKYKNPKPMVDVIIQKENSIILVERGKEPYKGKLATPGGFV
jgi:hypothetical protein